MLRSILKAGLLLVTFAAFAQGTSEFEEPRKPADKDIVLAIYASLDSNNLREIIASTGQTKTYPGRDDVFKVTVKAVEYKQDDWSAKGAVLALEDTITNPGGWDKLSIQVSDIGGHTKFTGLAEKGIAVSQQTILIGSLEQALVLTKAGIEKGLTSMSASAKVGTRMKDAVLNVSLGGTKVSDDNMMAQGKASVQWNPTRETEVVVRYDGYTDSRPTPDYYSPEYFNKIIAAASAAAPFLNGWRAIGTVAAGWEVAKNAVFDPSGAVIGTEVASKPAYLAELSITSPKTTVSKKLNPITISFNAGYSYDGAREGGYKKTYAMLQVSIPI